MASISGATRTSIGRQFYSWSTLGSFAGSVSAVTILRQVAQSLSVGAAGENWFALVAAFSVVVTIAIVTEPSGAGASSSTKVDKLQKGVQTFFNALLVYAAVIGLPTATGGGS